MATYVVDAHAPQKVFVNGQLTDVNGQLTDVNGRKRTYIKSCLHSKSAPVWLAVNIICDTQPTK